MMAALIVAFALAIVPQALAQAQLPGKPWIFGHRGSAGSMPEHTLATYALGIAQGAHFIECDVVLTKDCVPICRHEPDVSNTTDALHKFPHLVRNETIDGSNIRGIFTVDLTLSQLKSLRAKERLYRRDQSYNNLYEIPTLQEQINLVKAADHVVGLVPETKHPTWFSQQNLPCLQGTNISAILLQTLQENGYDAGINSPEWRRRPVIIQSFEVLNLQWLASQTAIPLMQLLDETSVRTADTNQSYSELMTNDALGHISSYAQVLGPWKGTIVPINGSAPEPVAANLTRRAHDHGLLMVPYTFRNDDPWTAAEIARGVPEQEYEWFLQSQQVDGFFSDFPETISFVLRNMATVPPNVAQPVSTVTSSR